MTPALNTAAAGLSAAFTRLDGAAQTLARGPGADGAVQASVDLITAKTQAKAAASVARTVDETTATLLDILA